MNQQIVVRMGVNVTDMEADAAQIELNAIERRKRMIRGEISRLHSDSQNRPDAR